MFQQLKLLLFILCFILVLPFVTIVFTIFWIYRKLITFLYNIWNGAQSGTILTTQSSVMFDEHLINARIMQLNIMFNGNVDYQSFCQLFQEKVVEAINANGQLKYPELGQRAHLWCGYNFWTKEVKRFNITDHVKCYEAFDTKSCILRDNEFCENLILETFYKPLLDENSKYIILLVPDIHLGTDSEKRTLIIFQFPHYLADGYSIYKMIMQLVDEPKIKLYEPKFRPSKCLQYISCPFSVITKSAKKLIKVDNDSFWATLPRNFEIDTKNSNPFLRHFVVSKKISTIDARRLANFLNVSLTSVFLCTFQKGVQHYIEKYGLEVPDYWSTLYPIPSPSHATTLTNDM